MHVGLLSSVQSVRGNDGRGMIVATSLKADALGGAAGVGTGEEQGGNQDGPLLHTRTCRIAAHFASRRARAAFADIS